MEKWEYQIIFATALDLKRINALGAQGWEAVAAVQPLDQNSNPVAGLSVLMKRRKK